MSDAETGPDRIRRAIEKDRGGQAPSQPFVVCDRSDDDCPHCGRPRRTHRFLDASHDQEPSACPDCGAEPDEDGWFPYGHDPECSIEEQSSE